MKAMKKLMALVLGIVMVMAMSLTAFAESVPCTITAPANGHTYQIYQIFTGDISDGKLINVKWGANGTGTQGADVTEEQLKALTEGKADADTYVNFESTAVELKDGASTQVATGYYLIKDKDETVPSGETYTKYIVKVCGNLTISPKSEKPSFEKKVIDANDTAGTNSNMQDSADYDIGDHVPFFLTGTVAQDFSSYAGKYYFAFHDKMESSLSFDTDSVEVWLNNVKVNSKYYSVVTSPEDGDTFDVVFDDLKVLSASDPAGAVYGGAKIMVTYTATLTEDAVCGRQGQTNTGYLEFSNNPNAVQSGGEKPETGVTPEDTVIVFTYKVDVDKYTEDENGNERALEGAAFSLYKEVAEGGETVEGLGDKKYQLVGAKEAGTATSFEWKGVDDGNYVLVETTTPSGFNSIAPIYFTVTATHEPNTDVTAANRQTILSGLDGGNLGTGYLDNGAIAAKVKNTSGSTLPETGGMGTTIFYIVGAVLMLGAAVVLITRKRMKAK